VISTEFEDRLREEMRHATAGVPVPAGLIRRARRGRRRRIVTRAGAASAVAAVAAASAVVVSHGTTGASRDSGVYTTAFVVRHVESALGAATGADEIAYLHAADGSRDLWLYDGPQGQSARTEIFSPAGQLGTEVGHTVTPAGLDTTTAVLFTTKTWWQLSVQEPAPQPPQPSCDAFSGLMSLNDSLADVTANIREALACGTLAYEGTQYVDGIDALKLVSVQTARLSPATDAAGATVTRTLWVDPDTYLPVRMATTTTSPEILGMTWEIQWLPPTSANLALLTVPIPPGFTRVAPPH
jgi:hypothetical protein